MHGMVRLALTPDATISLSTELAALTQSVDGTAVLTFP